MLQWIKQVLKEVLYKTLTKPPFRGSVRPTSEMLRTWLLYLALDPTHWLNCPCSQIIINTEPCSSYYLKHWQSFGFDQQVPHYLSVSLCVSVVAYSFCWRKKALKMSLFACDVQVEDNPGGRYWPSKAATQPWRTTQVIIMDLDMCCIWPV